MAASDPFAAPAGGRVRPDTHLGLWSMRSSFPVGGSTVEVETTHWTGRETTRVDGVEVLALRNLGWHTEQRLDVGGHAVVVSGRWYPLLPVEVRVDGQPWVDDLFPQLWPIKAVLATAALPLAVLVASIAWDLARLAGLG